MGKIRLLLLVICSFVCVINAPAQTYKLGDIDRDNELGITDVMMLPFAGYMSEAVCKEKGNLGYYWTSTKYADNTNCAYSLGFGGSNPGTGYAYRYEGRPIRPVAK